MSVFDFPRRGAAPWAGQPYNFAGWVPTISGHLSFSLIGSSEIPQKCRSFNRRTTTAQRVVAVMQRRSAQDTIVPNWLLRHLAPAIEQEYLLIGRTNAARTPFFDENGFTDTLDEQGVLAGQLVVVPKDKNRRYQHRRKKLLRGIANVLDNEFIAAELVPDVVTKLISDARLSGVACCTMQFALFRTGELRVWFDMNFFLGRQTHVQAIPPSSDEVALAQMLPAQAYFFAKDMAHQHYHHEPDSDQLLPFTQLNVPNSMATAAEDELHWRRETLWGLARVVAQFRRQNRLYDFKKALGVLAYADAFQSTLARVERGATLDQPFQEQRELSRYDFDHSRASVEAMEGLASWRRSGWIQAYAILAGVMLSSLALWASAVQVRPLVCPVRGTTPSPASANCPPMPFTKAVRGTLWVTEHPWHFMGGLLILGFAIFILIFRDATFVPFGRAFARYTSLVSKALGASTARILSNRFGRKADWLGYIVAVGVMATLLSGVMAAALWALFRH